jgi:hypothetical protein
MLLCFCPDFEDPKKCSLEILETLKKECELYSFVLMKHFGGNNAVNPDEIERLKKYSDVFL